MSKDASQLLRWYDKHKRQLPWRNKRRTKRRDAYRVWLVEIMLQQTLVAAVIPYYEKFLARYPRLADLANARDEDVMRDWAGLGYYQRARNMLKCARMVMSDYGGKFPESEEELLRLPGVGAYTAAAIAAIAFGARAAPVDGNIERVLARRFGIKTPLPALKKEIKARAMALVPKTRAGDFAEAMMDLGSTICTPKKPQCTACAWRTVCVARQTGVQEDLPRRLPKPAKPTRQGMVYWLVNRRGQVLVMRRGEKGLLAGTVCFPSRGWDAPNDTRLASLLRGWRSCGEVRHTFTHFHLQLKIMRAKTPIGFRAPRGYFWCSLDELEGEALPSLMRKVLRQLS